MKLLASILAIALFPPLAAATDNWPQWRGPEVNGTAPGSEPPVEWSETKNVKWKVKLPGSGTSTPIVWGERIFVTTAVPTGEKSAAAPAEATPPPPAPGQGERRGRRFGPGGGGGGAPTEKHRFVLLCLDRATGKVLWEKAAREEVPHEGHHQDHGFASSSPVTDGQWVWAFFGSRGLHAYDFEGNLKWSKDLGRMRTRNAFGEGASPLLVGDTLVVNWDHEGDDFTAAFDKKDGRELWRQKRDEPTSWSTPLAVTHEGKTQVVVSATNRVRSYDLATGKLLWESGGMTTNVIPSPITANGMVYAISGFRGNALHAIKLGGSGDLTDSSSIAWKYDKKTPYVPSPLLSGDRLYFYSQNTAILSCLNAKTGAVLMDAERIEGMSGVYASPVAASGHVFLLGRNGEGVVIKDADKLEIVSTNKLDEKFDASPAIAGNELFLRGHQWLYCVAAAGK